MIHGHGHGGDGFGHHEMDSNDQRSDVHNTTRQENRDA
jgi:hypothetical protein